MAGGDKTPVKRLDADLRGAGARERLGARRRLRRGPLREDGPQRDRVRDDAGVRRGLRADEPVRVRARHVRHRRASGGTGRSSARGCSSSCTRRSSSTGTSSTTSHRSSRTPARGAGRSTRRSTTHVPLPAITVRALRPLRLAPRDRLLREGAGRAPQPVRRARGPGGREGEEPERRPARMTTARQPAPRRAAAAAHAGPVRARHLRRVRRPDAAQALPRAVLARGAPPAARALRDHRRRAHAAVDEGVGRGDEEGGRRARARRAPRGRLGRARRRDALRRRPTSPTTRARMPSSKPLRELDEQRGTGGNRVYYLAVPPAAFETIVGELGERRSADGWTRLIVEKPFGHDRASAAAERDPAAALLRGRGLPDRPLPRQGDRPEHAGAAVRERHLRADLEPPVHRPRADHGRRVDRDRGPRRLLRVGGRDPRHLPEPPPPARRADRDGAADRLHRRLRAQREGEGAAVAAHARAEVGRARPVRARLRRGRGGARATARRRGSRATR